MKVSALIILLRVLALLPVRATRIAGTLLGHMCWWLNTRLVQTTRINLELCYPHLGSSERNLLARNSIVHTFMTIAEAGPVWLWPPNQALALIRDVDGLALMQQAYALGKGVIILAPHLGNWEMVGLYLNTCGCGQTSQLYQAPDHPQLDKLIFHARSRAGAQMVATDNKGVAKLLQALRAGEVVGILPDQVPAASGGEFAPFFGVPALTMTLALRLQQKTGARFVLAYARRTGDGFRMAFRAPPNDIYAEHMPTALAAMNMGVEQLIKESPEQYQWGYKRFKRQPEGFPRVYP